MVDHSNQNKSLMPWCSLDLTSSLLQLALLNVLNFPAHEIF